MHTQCFHSAAPCTQTRRRPERTVQRLSRQQKARLQQAPQPALWGRSQRGKADGCTTRASDREHADIWTPPHTLELPAVTAASGGATVTSGYDEHRARTPPPDLPSLLLDSRIVYLGMPGADHSCSTHVYQRMFDLPDDPPAESTAAFMLGPIALNLKLVPAVSELIVAELLYLQYQDRTKPLYMYINSTGTSRADGETVGFETEGTAIYDTMCYLKNEINTVGVGVAIGQSCMILSAGTKGKRFMLPHATAMLQQPRVPPTGQRQAVEIQIKWREVLAQKQALLEIMSKTTGHSVEKLDVDMQRPLYMQPKDAIEYGIVDGIVQPEQTVIGNVKKPEQYDKEAGLVARPA